MPESLFDVNTFLETQQKGNMDTRYVLPPEGDYTATSTDKVTSQSGVVQDGAYAGNIWGRVELQWELQDENLKVSLNMPRVIVRQSIMLDFDQEAWKSSKKVVLDWGINKNMRAKRLLDATGLNSMKNWNWNMLKHQTCLVHVTHRKIENYDDPIAEVDRVAPLSRGATRAVA